MTTIAQNPMSGLEPGGTDPGLVSFAITPDDNNDLPLGTRWIYVGGAGAVKLTCVNDNSSHTGVVLSAVPVGTLLRVAARRVYSTGTTATLLIGFA
jgi:hypothetical protein